ncbi:MAG: hypothetical protein R2849_06440 [Thermomicrobiales bacterium]
MEALCEDLSDAAPGTSVLNQLTGLVDKSLVMVAIDDSGAWYRLLEPVRQHALEQLVTAEEATEARNRHAAYYLSLAEQSEVGLRGPDQALWLDRLEREHGNLRAALDWAHAQSASRRQGSADVPNSLELRLAAALAPFWEIHGHLREGLHRLRDVLERDRGNLRCAYGRWLEPGGCHLLQPLARILATRRLKNLLKKVSDSRENWTINGRSQLPLQISGLFTDCRKTFRAPSPVWRRRWPSFVT